MGIFFLLLIVFAGTAALTVQLQCSQAQPLQVAETGSPGEFKKNQQNKTRTKATLRHSGFFDGWYANALTLI